MIKPIVKDMLFLQQKAQPASKELITHVTSRGDFLGEIHKTT